MVADKNERESWWYNTRAPSGGRRRCHARAFPHIGIPALRCFSCLCNAVRTFALFDRRYSPAGYGVVAHHHYLGAVAECTRCGAVFDLDDDATI